MTLQEWFDAQDEMTDERLAKRVGGISRSQINRIRTGASKPTPETARKLEAVTGIPAHKFVMGEAA